MDTLTDMRARLAAGAGLALAAAVICAGAGQAAAPPADGGEQWLQALELRSEALQRLHGLGEPAAGETTEPAWMRALRIRSEALNRLYGLGDGTS